MKKCSADCDADCDCNNTVVEQAVFARDSIAIPHPQTSFKHRPSTPLDDTQDEAYDSTTKNEPETFAAQAKAYNDFAQGGYIQSDRDQAKRAEEEAAKALREKQEMDQFDALFGRGTPKTSSTSIREGNGTKILSVKTDEQGVTRTRYQEIYRVSQPEVKTPAAEKEEEEEEEEVNLLDL